MDFHPSESDFIYSFGELGSIACVSRMQESKCTADWDVLLLKRLVNMVNIENNYGKHLSHKCVNCFSAVCTTAGFAYHSC